MKFRAEGKSVVTDNGVVRVKSSKSAAEKTAERLNATHEAKQQGYVTWPRHSYRPVD